MESFKLPGSGSVRLVSLFSRACLGFRLAPLRSRSDRDKREKRRRMVAEWVRVVSFGTSYVLIQLVSVRIPCPHEGISTTLDTAKIHPRPTARINNPRSISLEARLEPLRAQYQDLTEQTVAQSSQSPCSVEEDKAEACLLNSGMEPCPRVWRACGAMDVASGCQRKGWQLQHE